MRCKASHYIIWHQKTVQYNKPRQDKTGQLTVAQPNSKYITKKMRNNIKKKKLISTSRVSRYFRYDPETNQTLCVDSTQSDPQRKGNIFTLRRELETGARFLSSPSLPKNTRNNISFFITFIQKTKLGK